MDRTLTRLIPALGILTLTVAACGTSSSSTATGGGSAAGISGCSGTVTVASDLPVSGSDAAIGGGTQNGVKLAVSQANAAHLLGGCTINYIPKDDASAAKGKHDPQQGAQNVTALTSNPAVVGIIGPFNSGVAVAELPISNAAGVLQISPSNTDPGLTIAGSDPDINTASLQPSGKITYFRVISNDVIQAAVMAQVTTKELNLKKIYVIDDQETYGKDLANYYEKDVKAAGATTTRQSEPGDTKDYRPVLTTAKGLGVDAVFFGGVASTGSGLIAAQMKDVGLAVPFLSGDGTVDPQYFKDGGTDGALASSAPDTLTLSSAQQFVTDYKTAYGTDPVAYSTYGFDAMNIMLNAIKNVIVANGGQPPADPTAFRTKVIAEVQHIDYKGTIGETRFDANGDTLQHSFTVYKAQNGTWVAKETISPAAS
ncbi:MAG TPA: branched-chain amino acid ABC transporter substrate-binding protein [Candidatus Dormibacteraeota bacterium]